MTRLLPTLSFSPFRVSELDFYHIIDDFIPDFDLFAAVPIVLGVVFLLVSDGLFSRQKASVFWLLVTVAAAVTCTYRDLLTRETLLPTQESLLVILALSAIAILGALLGWRGLRSQTKEYYQPRSRAVG